jgi:hypothetical protein
MKRFTSLGIAQAGSALLIGLVILVVVAVASLAAWKINTRHKDKQPSTAGQQSPSTSDSTSQTSRPLTSGTDDQSLAKDISNLNGSVNEGSQNLQSTSNAVGDQSQVIDVPTN